MPEEVIRRIVGIEREEEIPLATTPRPKCLIIHADTSTGVQGLLITEDAARQLHEKLKSHFAKAG
jgi:hypothetical protein